MSASEGHSSPSWYERQWRWFVLGTLFWATFLNYFDRQTLGTAIEPIAREFGLDSVERGNLLSAFIYSYAFCHLFVGFILDRTRNVRLLFPVMLVGWSLSTMLVGLAASASQILWLRVLLGAWESVNFPLCLLIIRRIFPAEERSLAAGVFASGAFLATLAAPPVVIFFSNHYNWRHSFVMAGLIGLVWLIPWLCIFRHPEQKSARWLEALSARSAGAAVPGRRNVAESLTSILRAPGFWGVALIGLGIIPSLYFATQWFPSFFTQALRHPYDQSLATKLSLIYLMQDVGLWAGGALVLRLCRKGMPILKARKVVMGLAYCLMMLVAAVPLVRSAEACVALLGLYVCGIGAFLGNQHAFKQDVDRREVATVAALVGAIETGFTAFVIQRVGLITKETADFGPVFLLLAGLATFAFAVACLFVNPKWLKIE